MYNLIKGVGEIYNKIPGIEYTDSKKDNKIEVNVKVDYDKLDYNKLKELAGDLLTSDDTFLEEDNLNINSYKEKYFKDYTCK